MTKKQEDVTRESSRNERIAFYSAWMATGFVAGWASSFIIFGFAGAGIGFLMARASELETKSMGGFFWHELPPRIILLWIVAALFSITGAVFAINTGRNIIEYILLGLQLGAIHGGILAYIPAKRINWLWLFPAIGLVLGLIIGGGAGGYIGSVVGLMLLYFIEMQQISEYADPNWKSGLLATVFWLFMTVAVFAADIVGMVYGQLAAGAGIMLGIFLVYILTLFLSRAKYKHRGVEIKAIQSDFDKTFPTQDEVAEQPEKLNDAIASLASALAFFAKNASLGDETLDKEGGVMEKIRPYWNKYKAQEMTLQEFLVQVLKDHGIETFKKIAGHLCDYNLTLWY